MTLGFLGPDPIEQQIGEVLRRIAAGASPADIETQQVDCKEERGRRGPGGTIVPGVAENEDAARHLVAEMACLANTPGGGAIIVGISDDGLRIGTELDAEWLRYRIYQLSNRALTVDVRRRHPRPGAAAAKRYSASGGAPEQSIQGHQFGLHSFENGPSPHTGSSPGSPSGGLGPSYCHWFGGGPVAPIANTQPVMVRRHAIHFCPSADTRISTP